MKLTALAATAALGWSVLGAGAALAGDLPAGGLTREEAAHWLTSHGHAANLHADASGIMIVSSSSGGVNWDLYFYDCTGGRCTAIQYAAGWTLRAGLDAAKLNLWNKDHRYIRAYFDPKENVFGEYDVDVSPGGSWEQLDESLRTWEIQIAKFKSYIGD